MIISSFKHELSITMTILNNKTKLKKKQHKYTSANWTLTMKAREVINLNCRNSDKILLTLFGSATHNCSTAAANSSHESKYTILCLLFFATCSIGNFHVKVAIFFYSKESLCIWCNVMSSTWDCSKPPSGVFDALCIDNFVSLWRDLQHCWVRVTNILKKSHDSVFQWADLAIFCDIFNVWDVFLAILILKYQVKPAQSSG